VTSVELAAEYAATAEAWRAFCVDRGQAVEAAPLALLIGPFTGKPSGDLLLDVMRAMRDASGPDRRLDVLIVLRQREQIALRGLPGGAR
jgi:hypothetical protein